MSRYPSIACTMIAAAALASVTACGPSGEKAGEQGANQAAPEAATPAAPTATTASETPAAFGPCSVCHSAEPGKTLIGPSLFGVVGRAAGSVPGYAYSPAMKASGITWNAETIDSFITSPHSLVAGTKMAYPGLKDAAKRAEIIRYLETLK